MRSACSLKKMIKNSILSASILCSPIFEYKKYNQILHQITIFPQATVQNQNGLEYIILSFRFRSIEFNKKRALPFFLAIELLTHRKCVASLSSRNIQA